MPVASDGCIAHYCIIPSRKPVALALFRTRVFFAGTVEVLSFRGNLTSKHVIVTNIGSGISSMTARGRRGGRKKDRLMTKTRD